jgi:ATP/maltotriose-dependent transcriptional regulator MalT
MLIDLTAWERYPVIWLRLGGDPAKVGNDPNGSGPGSSSSLALESYCQLQGKLYAPVWLQAVHNQPDRFIAAVEGAFEAAARLSADPAPPAAAGGCESAWICLINRISELERPLLLVLNGYDQIENEMIHALVAQLLDYQPGTLQIVLVCQPMPPLPLPRLRARRALLEVSWG